MIVQSHLTHFFSHGSDHGHPLLQLLELLLEFLVLLLQFDDLVLAFLVLLLQFDDLVLAFLVLLL